MLNKGDTIDANVASDEQRRILRVGHRSPNQLRAKSEPDGSSWTLILSLEVQAKHGAAELYPDEVGWPKGSAGYLDSWSVFVHIEDRGRS
jgi:hypothetical protein